MSTQTHYDIFLENAKPDVQCVSLETAKRTTYLYPERQYRKMASIFQPREQ